MKIIVLKFTENHGFHVPAHLHQRQPTMQKMSLLRSGELGQSLIIDGAHLQCSDMVCWSERALQRVLLNQSQRRAIMEKCASVCYQPTAVDTIITNTDQLQQNKSTYLLTYSCRRNWQLTRKVTLYNYFHITHFSVIILNIKLKLKISWFHFQFNKNFNKRNRCFSMYKITPFHKTYTQYTTLQNFFICEVCELICYD